MTERLADDLHLYILDEGGIVFRESTQEIYSLNTMATYLWCLVEEGVETEALAPRLAEAFGLSPAKATRYASDSITDWHKHGFFGAPTHVDDQTEDESVPKESEKPISLNGLPIRQKYQIFDQYFEVGYCEAEAARRANFAIGHLAVASEPGGAEPVAVERSGVGYVVRVRGWEPQTCRDLNGIATAIQMAVFLPALRREAYALAIHAAAVAVGDRCLVMPGQAGSGKSTLAAGLIYNEYDYLTDDLILLHEPDLRAEGVPFSISVKEDDSGPVTCLYPDLRDQPHSDRWDSARMRFLAPRPGRNGSRRRYDIGWLVFPRYDSGAKEAALRPLSRAIALQRLLSSLSWRSRLTPDIVMRLVGHMRSIDCHELRHSSLSAATRKLAQLVADRR